jgi:hypothetical protein
MTSPQGSELYTSLDLPEFSPKMMGEGTMGAGGLEANLPLLIIV